MRALCVAFSGVAAWLMATGAGGAEPEPGEASEQTYRVRWVPGAQVAGPYEAKMTADGFAGCA